MGQDCDRLLQELDDLLHGDISPTTRAALEEHLQACPPCFERADFQAQFRQLVAKRCCESPPEALRARVLAVLQVEVRGGDSGAPGAPS